MLPTSPSQVSLEVCVGSYATCTAASVSRDKAPAQEPAALHNEAMWSVWGVATESTIAQALGLDDGFTAEPADSGAALTADAYGAAVRAALADVDPQDEPAALAALALMRFRLGVIPVIAACALVGLLLRAAGLA